MTGLTRYFTFAPTDVYCVGIHQNQSTTMRNINPRLSLAAVVAGAFFLGSCTPKPLARSQPTLFVAGKNGKVGYIDAKGIVKIPLVFDGADGFSEGLAAVSVQNLYGIIDEHGKWVHKPQYSGISIFSEGRAIACISENPYVPDARFAVIDRRGNPVNGESYVSIRDFSEGLARVLIGKRFGFIDKQGKIVIQPMFDSASDFHQGLAAVGFGTGDTVTEGYADKSGVLVISPKYRYAGEFSEGLAAVGFPGKMGFIDESGKVAIPMQFSDAGDFSEGLAVVAVGDNTVVDSLNEGYIDRTGKMVIPPKFGSVFPPDAANFSKGLTVVCIQKCDTGLSIRDDKRLGYIRHDGSFFLPPAFGGALPFTGDLAQACLNGKCGWINHSGHFVWTD